MEPSSVLPTECDIVMEGGVTSGVVYPSFVARLATRFTLRSIGGTSVGAVAAVAAAAAQYRRNASRASGGTVADNGFGELEKLPDLLQATGADGKSRLFTLFQPCRDLRRHFAVIEIALNRKGMWGRIGAVLLGVLLNFPLAALAGVATVFALHVGVQHLAGAVDAVRALFDEPFSLLSMVLWMPLGAFAFAAGWFVLSAIAGLSSNNGGICPGTSAPGTAQPALTEWLHGLVQQIAGLPPEQPLTFGHLQASQPPIELAFMSTGISEFRAHRLPHDGEDLLFRVSDMRRLFPPAIVQAMCQASRLVGESSKATIDVLREADPEIDNDAGRDLYFLPAADALPVVVCARMSLSFPVLLPALYRKRWPQQGHLHGAPRVVLRRRPDQQFPHPLLRLAAADPAHLRHRAGQYPGRRRSARGAGAPAKKQYAGPHHELCGYREGRWHAVTRRFPWRPVADHPRLTRRSTEAHAGFP